uniref:uncharacterized protein LOC103789601 n=1 Tax=Callithrix jacchus TaxID=9483 RepID=UPI0023DD0878|nr:uncharacterized protein LOC103789601 [Callithrix jacchus]
MGDLRGAPDAPRPTPPPRLHPARLGLPAPQKRPCAIPLAPPPLQQRPQIAPAPSPTPHCSWVAAGSERSQARRGLRTPRPPLTRDSAQEHEAQQERHGGCRRWAAAAGGSSRSGSQAPRVSRAPDWLAAAAAPLHPPPLLPTPALQVNSRHFRKRPGPGGERPLLQPLEVALTTERGAPRPPGPSRRGTLSLAARGV